MGGTTWQRVLGGAQVIGGAVSMYYGNRGGGMYLLGRGAANLAGSDKYGSQMNGKGFLTDVGGYLGGSGLSGTMGHGKDSTAPAAPQTAANEPGWNIGQPTRQISFLPQGDG